MFILLESSKDYGMAELQFGVMLSSISLFLEVILIGISLVALYLCLNFYKLFNGGFFDFDL